MAPNPEDLVPTRYSLLSRLQNWDDQESWKIFFDTYWRLIYSVAISSGLNEAEAQDVVQETVICVAKDIHKFKRDRKLGSFKGWLRNLTRWRIHDQLRKRMPTEAETGESGENGRREGIALEDVVDSGGHSLEDIWEKEWQENLFEAAVDRVKRRVKEEQFQMFDLYVVKKWPVEKVAGTLGVSTGQVYLAKHRITGLIKKEIQQLEKNLF
jgi:RNA polymerase sigma factor (sigma-70 family)